MGKLPAKKGRKVVSIVGARKCTRYGENIAYKTAYQLAERGFIVVSGMAYGIDACAHRGCLDAGGTTVAVLGTPINYLYPSCNRALAHRIMERGAILSEYPPGSETRNWHFLCRNRIVTGLADVLLVVEAGERSGTLTTAAMAVAQGKDVFVVPGDITRPISVGCNRLIRDGANPFTDINDILAEHAPDKATFGDPRLDLLSDEELRVYKEIASGNNDGDVIMKKLSLSFVRFCQIVTILEVRQIVLALGGNKWRALV